MELIREKWNKEDIDSFSQMLLSYSKGEYKSMWEKRIVNTAMRCIAVPSVQVDRIAKDIAKGNYKDFLDFMPWNNLTETLVVGKVINHIKNIDDYLKYLAKYVHLCDSWAQTDILKYPITSTNEKIFWSKAESFLKSKKVFVKRCGLLILMKGFLNEKYIDKVFELLDTLVNDDEYYVLMMMAWLLCEGVIKCREKTIEYISNCNLCDFVINKAISKCSDSYRISIKDKEYLKTLRRRHVHDIVVKKVEYVDYKK